MRSTPSLLTLLQLLVAMFKGLQVMMLKEAGNISIEKLRAILLIKSDYNWLPRLLLSERMGPWADTLVIIPEKEFGRCSNHQAIEVAVCRRFFWDHLWQLQNPWGLGLEDVAQCYNKIVHLFCSLGALCWNMLLPAIYMLFLTIQWNTWAASAVLALWLRLWDNDP